MDLWAKTLLGLGAFLPNAESCPLSPQGSAAAPLDLPPWLSTTHFPKRSFWTPQTTSGTSLQLLNPPSDT